MSNRDLSEALNQLLNRHMTSMDHVALLLALKADPERSYAPAELVQSSRLTPVVVDRVLEDLVTSRLAQREAGTFRYAPAPDVQPAVEELAQMYRTKPVTLVRAIYDRPARAAQSFADAFRLRKTEE